MTVPMIVWKATNGSETTIKCLTVSLDSCLMLESEFGCQFMQSVFSELLFQSIWLCFSYVGDLNCYFATALCISYVEHGLCQSLCFIDVSHVMLVLAQWWILLILSILYKLCGWCIYSVCTVNHFKSQDLLHLDMYSSPGTFMNSQWPHLSPVSNE